MHQKLKAFFFSIKKKIHKQAHTQNQSYIYNKNNFKFGNHKQFCIKTQGFV